MNIEGILNIIEKNSFNSEELERIFEAIIGNHEFIENSTHKKIEFHLRLCSNMDIISLGFIAGKLCMSERTLCRRLQRENLKFSHLVDEERKNRCYQLLRNGTVNGTTIALALGFSEPAYFYQKFGKWSGFRFSEAKLLLAHDPDSIDEIFNVKSKRRSNHTLATVTPHTYSLGNNQEQ